MLGVKKNPTNCLNAAQIATQTQTTPTVPVGLQGGVRTGSTSAAELNKAQILSTFPVPHSTDHLILTEISHSSNYLKVHTIPERFGLGGTMKIISFLSPLPWGWDTFHHPRVFQTPPNLALATSRGSHNFLGQQLPKLLTKSPHHTNWAWQVKPGDQLMFLCHVAPSPLPLPLQVPPDQGLQETNPPPELQEAFPLPVAPPGRLELDGSVVPLQGQPDTAGAPARLQRDVWTEGGLPQGGECSMTGFVCLFVVRKITPVKITPVIVVLIDTCKTMAACRILRKRLLSKTILSQLWRRMIFLITSLCSVSCSICRSASFMKTCSVKEKFIKKQLTPFSPHWSYDNR